MPAQIFFFHNGDDIFGIESDAIPSVGDKFVFRLTGNLIVRRKFSPEYCGQMDGLSDKTFKVVSVRNIITRKDVHEIDHTVHVELESI